jgi:hypothetical protein
MNEEAAMRIQLPYELDIKEVCKNIKQCYFSYYFMCVYKIFLILVLKCNGVIIFK